MIYRYALGSAVGIALYISNLRSEVRKRLRRAVWLRIETIIRKCAIYFLRG